MSSRDWTLLAATLVLVFALVVGLVTGISALSDRSGAADPGDDKFPQAPSDWVEVPAPVQDMRVWCYFDDWQGAESMVCVTR